MSAAPDPQSLFPGDPVPWITGASAANPAFRLASLGGRYILLAFAGPVGGPAMLAARDALGSLLGEGILDDDRALAMVVGHGPRGPAMPEDRVPGLRFLADADGVAHRAFGLLRGAAPGGAVQLALAAFLIDPQLRVIASAPLERIAELGGLLRRLPPPHLHAGQESPAPVLVLPRVFEPGLCDALVALYQRQGGEESGFMEERDGRTVLVQDFSRKRRTDCLIEDPELQGAVRARIIRRLVPEMRKAFHYEATRIERYMIARYDAAMGGHFAAHRDNTTPGTAHRRFAVTINLNGDFDGGELRFPEYGSRLYRPPPGGAVVFSCSLLHEATPVTRGLRYAVLPFLYDAAAAEIRAANAGTIEPVAAPGG